jgi:hypothetical protein
VQAQQRRQQNDASAYRRVLNHSFNLVLSQCEASMTAKAKTLQGKSAAIFAAFGALVLMSLLPMRSWAEDYPSRTVKIIVPFEPGGGNDLLARIIGEKLSESLHQPVIIDNRPGAGTQIGAELQTKIADGRYRAYSKHARSFRGLHAKRNTEMAGRYQGREYFSQLI